MGEWEPDETADVGCGSYCTAHLWIVPAHVDGTWHFADGDLTLKQSFQTFTGMLNARGKSTPVLRGHIDGDQVRFTSGGTEYRGRVSERAIEGTTKVGDNAGTWKATR
jgi:hypothetical protein